MTTPNPTSRSTPRGRDAQIDELERRVQERTQELEEMNRRLMIERAVKRVRAEATAMRESTDIGKVIIALEEGLRDAGLRFEGTCINIVDEEADVFQCYILGIQEFFPKETLPQDRIVRENIVEGIHLLRAEVPLAVARKRPWARPELGSALWTAPETHPDDHRMLWGVELPPDYNVVGRSGMNVPFAYGGIFVVAEEGLEFGQGDLHTVEQFADAVSLGYTRFLDLQAAEERNRQLVLEHAVERVRSEAMSMRASEDMLNVVVVLFQEMVNLGIETPGCNITFVDEEADRVIDYGALENPRKYGISWTSPSFVELDDETAVLTSITTIAEAADSGAIDSDAFKGGPGGVLEAWHQRETWCAEFDESDTQILIDLLGLDRPVPWTGPGWIGTAVAFRYGKVGFRERRYSEEHVPIIQELAEGLEIGYLRFLDFQRLEEQNRALEAANREIERANQAKSEFLAHMSHELRTPMNAVLGFTEMILDGIYGDVPEEIDGVMKEIDRSGRHLLELINDVLDLSKIEAGEMELHTGECSPELCVEDAILSMEVLAEQKGLRVVREVEEGIPAFTADEMRIGQVLRNLLSNAVKFTKEGEIGVGARREGGDVVFWVRDTGVGIPEEEQASIFEEFHQVSGTVAKGQQGTGLGLSLCQRFVRMHGGRIWVESVVGEGSTFWFTVPT